MLRLQLKYGEQRKNFYCCVMPEIGQTIECNLPDTQANTFQVTNISYEICIDDNERIFPVITLNTVQ